jgi:hypothetical protein
MASVLLSTLDGEALAKHPSLIAKGPVPDPYDLLRS